MFLVKIQTGVYINTKRTKKKKLKKNRDNKIYEPHVNKIIKKRMPCIEHFLYKSNILKLNLRWDLAY